MSFDPRAAVVSIACALAFTFVSGLLARAWILRVKPDHFLERADSPRSMLTRLFGGGVIALGVVMLVLPGPGVLTILLGVFLMGGSLRRAVERKILHQPKIRAQIDAMRRRAGREPLLLPED